MVLGKTLESPLDCKEIQPVNPKGNQFWIFIERTDAEAETPILWPPDGKNWLIRKELRAIKIYSVRPHAFFFFFLLPLLPSPSVPPFLNFFLKTSIFWVLLINNSKVWGYNSDPKQICFSDGASDLMVAQAVSKSHIIKINKWWIQSTRTT